MIVKKYLTTLLVAASTAIHAQAADLESQLPGYWQPDVAKTLAVAKKQNIEIDPLTELMLGKMVFEFQKDKMIMHGPPGTEGPPLPYTVKDVDKAANSLTIVVEGEEQKARFHEGQMALHDPENGWIIFNRLSKEDFAKRPADEPGFEGEGEGGGEAPAAGKLEDVSAQPIPDKPAAGKVHGKEFKVEKAIFDQNMSILKLQQGEGFFGDMLFSIFIFGDDDDKIEGKKIAVKPNEDSGNPHIHMYYKIEAEGRSETKIHIENYTMSLEFGTAKDGKLPGKIHLRLPDEAGSFVVGSFVAEIK